MTGQRKLPPPPVIPGDKAATQDLFQLQTQVAGLLGRDSIRFPGAQPVSFSSKHLQELQEQDYYVCEKSDGIRCLMYLTSNTAEQEMVFLIDRKNDYYLVPELHFPLVEEMAKFHTDTIIDGELVNDLQKDGTVKMKYLVFDCLVLDRIPLLDRILDKRLGYFREKVFKPFVQCFEEYPEDRARLPFYVEFKHMERAYGLQMLFETILPNLAHGNDGLIFTCRNTPYCPGTDPHIIKWKPPNENSIDFRLFLEFPPLGPEDEEDDEYNEEEDYNEEHPTPSTSTPTSKSKPPPKQTQAPAPAGTGTALNYTAPPTFHLAIGTSTPTDALFSTMHVPPADLLTIQSLQRPMDEAIVECYRDAEGRWRFMRVRDDKTEPNHVSTVEKVLESISDRVRKEDLVGIGKKVRDRWKERERV